MKASQCHFESEPLHLGIFWAMTIAKSYGFAKLPENTTQLKFLGVACLCGIGFTLSLFIGLLAFESVELENQMKIGVLLASFVSALIGVIIINASYKYQKL